MLPSIFLWPLCCSLSSNSGILHTLALLPLLHVHVQLFWPLCIFEIPIAHFWNHTLSLNFCCNPCLYNRLGNWKCYSWSKAFSGFRTNPHIGWRRVRLLPSLQLYIRNIYAYFPLIAKAGHPIIVSQLVGPLEHFIPPFFIATGAAHKCSFHTLHEPLIDTTLTSFSLLHACFTCIHML